ncbi:MAG TPA: lytic transglycosylase domain-containing protein, partial [Adhaeribacter sp.]|nr:lytic transglycosylase domain-containing protein [Adhaeribacter sp.]
MKTNTLLMAAGGAAGSYALYQYLNREKLTLQAKLNRNLVFSPGGVSGFPVSPILTAVKVPMVSSSHYKESESTGILAALDRIQSQYGTIAREVALLTRVPYRLILAMIFIESNGDQRIISSAGAVGLMQIIPTTATSVVALENIKKRLTQQESEYLRLFLKSRLDCIL